MMRISEKVKNGLKPVVGLLIFAALVSAAVLLYNAVKSSKEAQQPSIDNNLSMIEQEVYSFRNFTAEQNDIPETPTSENSSANAIDRKKKSGDQTTTDSNLDNTKVQEYISSFAIVRKEKSGNWTITYSTLDKTKEWTKEQVSSLQYLIIATPGYISANYQNVGVGASGTIKVTSEYIDMYFYNTATKKFDNHIHIKERKLADNKANASDYLISDSEIISKTKETLGMFPLEPINIIIPCGIVGLILLISIVIVVICKKK